MTKNGNKGGVIELWGRKFNLAEKGLDEAQVVPFVDNLITERDTLIQRTEHLSSLSKLAEKTIAEADKLAKELKREAMDGAKAEVDEMIAKAEEQVRQMVKEERTKVINAATEEAVAIKANAEQAAELLLENQRGKIQHELRDIAQRIYGQLLSQFESLRQQVKASEAEFELKLSQPAEEASTVTVEKELPSTPAPAATQQKEDITSSPDSEVSPEHTGAILPESQRLIQTIDLTNADNLGEKASVSIDKQDTTTYAEEVELEILPPIDITKIMGIMRYLDSLPEVETTELIPIVDKPLIIASLRESIPLVDILRTLPEVEQVKENSDATNANGERRKIQITLSGKIALDEAKVRLDSKLSDTLSPQPQ